MKLNFNIKVTGFIPKCSPDISFHRWFPIALGDIINFFTLDAKNNTIIMETEITKQDAFKMLDQLKEFLEYP